MSRRVLTFALLASLVAVGCTSSDKSTSRRSRQKLVVTTVAPITNIVENIAGTAVRVRGLVPPGTDSHTFEPRPSDAKLFADADLVIVNGLNLEQPTRAMAARNARKGVTIRELGERTIDAREWVFDFSFPEQAGQPNPHLWMNPMYAARYALIVRDELSLLVPAKKDEFAARYDTFNERILDLDARIKAASATVPSSQRRLLTYHDSFAYFAPRYGYTVIGAIQPADFAQPSAKDVADLVKQIKSQQVKAIFGAEEFPSTVLKQIASETGIAVVSTLSDDSLPQKHPSYLGMMVANVRTMVTALGGDAAALDGFDASNIT